MDSLLQQVKKSTALRDHLGTLDQSYSDLKVRLFLRAVSSIRSHRLLVKTDPKTLLIQIEIKKYFSYQPDPFHSL